MARTEFEKAYVDKILLDKNGNAWGLKTSEVHYRKNGEEYEVKGRTFRTVSAAYGVSIDFSQFGEGDVIAAAGKEETEEREYQDKKYYDLLLKAEFVNLVKKAGNNAGWGDAAIAQLGGVEINPDAPF